MGTPHIQKPRISSSYRADFQADFSPFPDFTADVVQNVSDVNLETYPTINGNVSVNHRIHSRLQSEAYPALRGNVSVKSPGTFGNQSEEILCGWRGGFLLALDFPGHFLFSLKLRTLDGRKS